MNELVTTWGGWAVALLSVALTGWFSIFGKKTNLEHQLIDQLQEQLKEQGDKIAALDRKVDALYVSQRVRDDYIAKLRKWISDGKGPPPPEYPEGML